MYLFGRKATDGKEDTRLQLAVWLGKRLVISIYMNFWAGWFSGFEGIGEGRTPYSFNLGESCANLLIISSFPSGLETVEFSGDWWKHDHIRSLALWNVHVFLLDSSLPSLGRFEDFEVSLFESKETKRNCQLGRYITQLQLSSGFIFSPLWVTFPYRQANFETRFLATRKLSSSNRRRLLIKS